MRRSAAPSSLDGQSRKRVKFRSPCLPSTKSPTQLPLRALNDIHSLLQDNKENVPPSSVSCDSVKSSDDVDQISDPLSSKSDENPVLLKEFTVPEIVQIHAQAEDTVLSSYNLGKAQLPPSIPSWQPAKKPKLKVFSVPSRVSSPGAAAVSSRTGPLITSSSSETGPSPRYFKAMYMKLSKKKHKTWEGDGILVVRAASLELLDTDNKPLGKKSQFKQSELADISVGSTFIIGGKEVMVDEEIPAETFNSGSCFSSISNPAAAVLPSTVSKPKGFQCPQRGGSTAPTRVKPKARHDPSAPGAVVLSPGGKDDVAVVLDPYLSDRMRPHQTTGVQFLYRCVMRPAGGRGAVLADDMGLGKTLQTIALVWSLLKQGPAGNPTARRILIVTPSSLVRNWKAEFRKWLGEERVRVWALAAGESTVEQFTSSPLYPVLVISYEMFRRSLTALLRTEWGLVVCDEGHRLKNVAAKIGEALNQLPCQRRVVLTGTPVQNNLKEFYTLVSFVNPGVLGTSRAFNSVFAEPIQASQLPNATPSEQALGRARSEELAKITSQFILRRTKEINEQYLPPKRERVLCCRASEAQANLYRSILASTQLHEIQSSEILEVICRLRKVCNHPCLTKDMDQEVEVEVGGSGKLAVTSSLLEEHVNKDSSKVVLVSNYTQTLDLLGLLCKRMGLTFHRLDGKTPQTKRQDLVDRFNSVHDRTPVFLLSSKAGGVGLNLIGGSVIILYDIDWNPATDAQALARVWRDGQTRPVTLYRLLTSGTIEEKIFQRQIRKQGLSTCVVDGGEAQCSFSQAELRDIFSYDGTTLSSSHDLLRCGCQGTFRPGSEEEQSSGRKMEEGEEEGGLRELMTWEHSFHSDPRVTFAFRKDTK